MPSSYAPSYTINFSALWEVLKRPRMKPARAQVSTNQTSHSWKGVCLCAWLYYPKQHKEWHFHPLCKLNKLNLWRSGHGLAGKMIMENQSLHSLLSFLLNKQTLSLTVRHATQAKKEFQNECKVSGGLFKTVTWNCCLKGTYMNMEMRCDADPTMYRLGRPSGWHIFTRAFSMSLYCPLEGVVLYCRIRHVFRNPSMFVG